MARKMGMAKSPHADQIAVEKILSDLVANMIENLFINVHIAYPMTQLVQL